MLNYLSKILLSYPVPRRLADKLFDVPYLRNAFISLYEMALARSQFFSPTVLKETQEARLWRLIQYAQKNIPFWATYLKDVRSLDDFSAVPPVSKEIMRQEFEKGTATNYLLRAYEVPRWTSGSTGVPFRFFLDRNMQAKIMARYRRMLSWVRYTPSDLVLRIMPREHFANEGVFFECGDLQDLENKLPKLFEIFKRESIILQTETSYLLRLAQLLEEHKKIFNFRALISFAEPLSSEMRAYFMEVFNTQVSNYYASNELLAIGFECEYANGFHVQSEVVYVEILDEFHKSLPPGKTGTVVVTSLDNEVMPFIKYILGDSGQWLEGSCLCGRTLPRIHIEGRGSLSFMLPNGKSGSVGSLVYPISRRMREILQYQVIRHSRFEYEVQVVPTRFFKEEEKELIEMELSRYLGPEAKLSLHIVEKIKMESLGKQKVFIDKAPDHIF